MGAALLTAGSQAAAARRLADGPDTLPNVSDIANTAPKLQSEARVRVAAMTTRPVMQSKQYPPGTTPCRSTKASSCIGRATSGSAGKSR
eukprot:4600734-Amphidinium_carterae.1